MNKLKEKISLFLYDLNAFKSTVAILPVAVTIWTLGILVNHLDPTYSFSFSNPDKFYAGYGFMIAGTAVFFVYLGLWLFKKNKVDGPIKDNDDDDDDDFAEKKDKGYKEFKLEEVEVLEGQGLDEPEKYKKVKKGKDKSRALFGLVDDDKMDKFNDEFMVSFAHLAKKIGWFAFPAMLAGYVLVSEFTTIEWLEAIFGILTVPAGGLLMKRIEIKFD